MFLEVTYKRAELMKIAIGVILICIGLGAGIVSLQLSKWNQQVMIKQVS